MPLHLERWSLKRHLSFGCSRNDSSLKAGVLVKFLDIKEVSDGEDLIEEIISGDYGLVFTDNHMLNMDGLEAIALIRNFNKTIPIYMFASSSSREEALRAGATNYFAKFKAPEMLVPLVIKHFGQAVSP